MSYQYPLPTSRPDLEAPSANLVNTYHLPPVGPLDATQNSSTSDSPVQNRGTQLPVKNSKMKRSSSTPNVRGQSTSESVPAAMSAEKRRNKLGYHRTSVACGHCRRRKIRCIPAAGDPQNRCSNCIRLKKECNFFPVDQQAQAESRSQREPQVHGQPGHGSSVSPTSASAHSAELQNGLPYQHLTMPPIQDLGNSQMKRPRNDEFSPEGKSWTQYNNNTGGWIQSEHPAMGKMQGEVPSTYWRGQESPLTPAFSPYPSNIQMPHQSGWPPSATEQSPREDMSWSVPQRSMSYGTVEGMPHHPAYAGFQQAPPSQAPGREEYTPRQSHQEAYSSTLPTTSTATPATVSSSSSTDQAHPSAVSQSQYSVPQGWQQPYAYPKAPGPDGYGGWYGHNSTLPSHAHSSGGEPIPATTYGQTEPYGGMYYNSGPQEGRQ